MDNVAILNTLFGVGLAMVLALQTLHPIATELPTPSGKDTLTAEACFESNVEGDAAAVISLP